MEHKIGSRFFCGIRSAIFICKSDRDYTTAIAIPIAIKNQSKIIANRFSFQIRIAILIAKSPEKRIFGEWLSIAALTLLV